MQSSSATETVPPMTGRAPKPPVAPAPVWLQRISLVVFVLFCFYIGGILAVLPWSPRYWDQNSWLMAHPGFHTLAIQGWIRGIVSGIGLVDVWIGISELIHYRDIR